MSAPSFGHRWAHRALAGALACGLGGCESAPAGRGRGEIGAVVQFTPGPGGMIGQDRLPDVLFGGPDGRGPVQGGADVLSLGVGGSIVVELDTTAVDGPGSDFVVFENAFRILGGTESYVEPGRVSVSEDGTTFVPFPCSEQSPHHGCAGLATVIANRSNGIAATDPQAGGDRFDLATIGVGRARYVKIEDLGTGVVERDAPSAGFDLDAIAVINR